MLHPFARRTAHIEPFLAMEVMERAFAMERAGTPVLHLEIGEPDFPPPPEAAEECARAGTEIDPERVLVTSGTSPAMLLVFALLVEPGDEVILGTPHYPCYPNFVRFCGGVPIFVPTEAESGYRLEADAVRRALGPRTRAIIVASPSNPTGAVQSREDVEALASLGLPLVSDEIYDGLVYDGARVTSALTASDQAYVLDGFSKRYAMTGFRLGYVIAPERALRPLQILQQNLFISANHFVQHAGIAALEHGAATVEVMRAAYERRRPLLVDGLRELGFRVPRLPLGAFYVFADARRFDSDSRRLAFALLEEAHVAATPGIDFGEAGEGWLRFSYAASEATIREALRRLAEALPRLR